MIRCDFVCHLDRKKKNIIYLQTPPGGGGTLYNGLYGEAPPERGTFIRLEVYKSVEISRVEV